MYYQLDQFVRDCRLRPGDGIVVRKRFLGLLKHYVVYLGKERGRHLFIANMTQGVQILNSGQIAEFLQYMEPRRIIPFEGTERERRFAVQRAFTYPNSRNYRLLANNCEHYFNYIHNGKGYSGQTAAFGAGLAVSGIVMAANNASKTQEEDENADLKVAAGILLTGLGLFAIAASDHD
ncbi:hypothetical protein AB832_07055 [Flavobacteriaceae bacterium (ex Bugula neritina AB1)]|nr:hypothetical protein AB832_07055 [Flavobacteriaceae bacterium (ex Bugula neritina AB1)]